MKSLNISNLSCNWLIFPVFQTALNDLQPVAWTSCPDCKQHLLRAFQHLLLGHALYPGSQTILLDSSFFWENTFSSNFLRKSDQEVSVWRSLFLFILTSHLIDSVADSRLEIIFSQDFEGIVLLSPSFHCYWDIRSLTGSEVCVWSAYLFWKFFGFFFHFFVLPFTMLFLGIILKIKKSQSLIHGEYTWNIF